MTLIAPESAVQSCHNDFSLERPLPIRFQSDGAVAATAGQFIRCAKHISCSRITTKHVKKANKQKVKRSFPVNAITQTVYLVTVVPILPRAILGVASVLTTEYALAFQIYLLFKNITRILHLLLYCIVSNYSVDQLLHFFIRQHSVNALRKREYISHCSCN